MKILNLIMLLSISFYCANALAAAKLTTEKQRFSYAVGVQISKGLKKDDMTLDTDSVIQAMKDVMAGKKLQMTQAEMKNAIKSAKKKQLNKRKATGEKAKTAGKEFLAKNKNKPGIITLVSGIQYKIIKDSKGKKPTTKDSVVAHYRGSLINGKVFDSSYKRKQPFTFRLSGVIKGWQEILPLMSVGSKWQIFIPPELGYGARGAGASIGPWETLIFDIELIKIKVSKK